MVAKLTNVLHGFVELLVQGTGQLHLAWQTSHEVTTFGRQHHIIVFFMGSAREMSVLGMIHLVVLAVL
jgi:hypothetical protein